MAENKCNISETPLSFTTEFTVNAFLHVTVLFTFLNILFYYIIAPLEDRLTRHEVGNKITDAINKQIPFPINFNIDGKFNCDPDNVAIKASVAKSCDKHHTPLSSPSSKITPDNTSSICDSIMDPVSKAVCLAHHQNITFAPSNTMSCEEYSTQLAQKNCLAKKQALNEYISDTPLFETFEIYNADDLYAALYSLVSSNTDGNNILDNYIYEYNSPNKLIQLHNKAVINYGINICIILFLITFTLIVFMKYSCNKCIPVTKILLENIITFTFIGGVEFWFFMTYASKYTPAPPSTLVATAFNTVKKFLVPIPSKFNTPT